MTPITAVDIGALIGMAGGGLGAVGLGLKFAHPFVAMMRTPRPMPLVGNGYEKGKDMGTLLAGIERQTTALGSLTAEVHNLVEANGEVLIAFRASLEKP